MAKRASETFVIALEPKGKAIIAKDSVVSAAIAKKVPHLVYDDTKVADVAAEPFVRRAES